MEMIIREDHVIRIPSGAVKAVNARVARPKQDLPPLPYAVLSQVKGIAERIAFIINDFSGTEGNTKPLLIEEAIINAVSHGNESDVTRAVRVKIRACLQDGVVDLVVTIEDEGVVLFSVEAEIDEALEIENLGRPNGRGLLIMRDSAKFGIDDPELLEDGAGKRLTFRKNIPLHEGHSLHSLGPMPLELGPKGE